MSATNMGNVLSWASDLDDNTAAQASTTAAMPFVEKPLALMPDAHLGKGSTIGSVIATHGAIIPAAVGVDIGCGMIAAKLPITASQLPDNLESSHSVIAGAVPAGQPRKGDKTNGSHTERRSFIAAAEAALARMSDVNATIDENRAAMQMGTLGGGNHFVELTIDEHDNVWLVLHSGSRGVGNTIATQHIKRAGRLMKRYFIELPDPDLAYLVEGTAQFDEYIHDMLWAQDYAAANRQAMVSATLAALGQSWHYDLTPMQVINCHHNYCEQENHHGRNLWVTRKGAIRARHGDMGVIPGSMATGSYIVQGLQSDASYHSASHGAGRTMSRTAARKNLTAESLDTVMRSNGIAWNNDPDGLLDEHPDAYKNIENVMGAQSDLVRPVARLATVLNYKGA